MHETFINYNYPRIWNGNLHIDLNWDLVLIAANMTRKQCFVTNYFIHDKRYNVRKKVLDKYINDVI